MFAVLGGYSFSAADLCVVDTNKTFLFNNNAFTIDELYNTGRHASIFMKASRMMANFANRADESGLIKGKRIGIVDDLIDQFGGVIGNCRHIVFQVVQQAVIQSSLSRSRPRGD